MFAQTAIKANGKKFEEGSEVKKSDIGDSDVWDQLVEAGALGDSPRGEDAKNAEIQRLRNEIARLQAEVGEVESGEDDTEPSKEATRDELEAEAKALGITGFSSMNKDQLAAAIEEKKAGS